MLTRFEAIGQGWERSRIIKNSAFSQSREKRCDRATRIHTIPAIAVTRLPESAEGQRGYESRKLSQLV